MSLAGMFTARNSEFAVQVDVFIQWQGFREKVRAHLARAPPPRPMKFLLTLTGVTHKIWQNRDDGAPIGFWIQVCPLLGWKS